MNWFLYLLGAVGNACFAAACLPMAWKCWREGSNTGIPVHSIWLFLIALTTWYTYMLGCFGFRWLQTPIGIVETISWLVVCRYHYFPRRAK